MVVSVLKGNKFFSFNGARYAGEKIPGDIDGMVTLDADVNQFLDQTYDILSRRSVTLYHTYPAVIGAIDKQTDYAIGDGLVFRSAPNFETLGITEEAARKWAQRFQQLIDFEFERLNFYQKQPVIFRTALETEDGGQVFIEQLDAMYKVMEDRIVSGREGKSLFIQDNIRGLKGRLVMAEKALELGLIDGILSSRHTTTDLDRKGSNNIGADMKLEEFLGKDTEAKAEFDALVEKKALEKANADVKGQVSAIIEAERLRISEITRLSGLKLSEEAQKAIESGADAGAYAKTRLETLNGAASNASSLGNPKPETNNFGSLRFIGALMTEASAKDIARNIRR